MASTYGVDFKLEFHKNFNHNYFNKKFNFDNICKVLHF